MGFSQRTSNITYCNISDGRVVVPVQEGTEGAETRVNKNGRTVHELIYGSVEGRIIDVRVKENKTYGIKEWQVFLEDGNEAICVSFPYSSRYANTFFRQLPNLDVSHAVTITPWMKEYNGKKKSALYLSQFGQNLEWHYTRENPNGMPELKKVKIKGVEQWDDSDILEFFENYLANDFLPKLKGSKPAAPAQQPAPQPQQPATATKAQPVQQTAAAHVEQTEEGEDDLPF